MTDFEKTMERHMRNQESLIQTLQYDNAQTITRLEVQMSQLANSQSERPKSKLSSQPVIIPRNFSQVHHAEDQVKNRIDFLCRFNVGSFFSFNVTLTFLYVTERREEFHGGIRASLY